MDALIISGYFDLDHEVSLHHTDDFRLTVEGVPMTISNMVTYFKNNRVIDNCEKRRFNALKKPYKQVYYSSFHLYNNIVSNGFSAEILNCHDINDSKRFDFYNKNPLSVVISTTFINMEAVRRITKDIRMFIPNTWIIVGGSFTRYSYLVWKRRYEPYYNEPDVLNNYFFTTQNSVDDVDAFIYDEHGERTLLKMLQFLKQGHRPQNLPNTVIALHDGPKTKWKFNESVPEDFTMDDHRIMWEKIPTDYLSTVIPFSNTYGCPFKCNFCNFSQTQMYKKSIDVVFTELHELTTHRVVNRVWFTDDNFFLTPKMVEVFCERYMKEKLPFQWMSFIRANSINAKTAELLRKSNCCLLILGLESGSQEMLNNMNKKDTIEGYKIAMNHLIKNGIDTEISFIFGYPGETDSTVTETINFINSLPMSSSQVNYLYLFKFNLLPLSGVFEENNRTIWNIKGNFNRWSHKTMDSDRVDHILHRVATETNTTVFNYLDSINTMNKEDTVIFMRLRDELSRNINIKINENPAHIENLWSKLYDFLKTKGLF
ncbi:radical SAM domain-containing protein [Candidatus Magnetobacterium bavaricum]|uniref:Radical SAM domain-containing protein n=1 Tax=Candidatus Magnetobacterium bavaricum TaxID=29290 RepID=A0A0F3H0M6_9BACT|nr:radical SAM domain-containing protein [Candidatus Magnetobacterium bavaricum]